MRYEVKFNGTDHGTAMPTATEFACTASFLDNVPLNDSITNFDGFVRDVGEEISAHLYFDWESALDAVDEDELEDEDGYYVLDDGNIRVRLYHGWGMSDTIALTVGAVIVGQMREQLRRYWIGRVVREKLFDIRYAMQRLLRVA